VYIPSENTWETRALVAERRVRELERAITDMMAIPASERRAMKKVGRDVLTSKGSSAPANKRDGHE
jgi:hypothetical protein